MGWEGVERKFRTLAGSVLPEAQVDRAVAAVRALDGAPDLWALVSACVPPVAG